MENLAIDVSGFLESHALRAHSTARRTADHNFVRYDAAFNNCTWIDDQHFAADIAVYAALDQNVALALKVALHGQPFVDDRIAGVSVACMVAVRARRVCVLCRRLDGAIKFGFKWS